MAKIDLKKIREESYAFLFENAPVGMMYIDHRGNILTVNPFLRSLLGFTGSEKNYSNMSDYPILAAIGMTADFHQCLETGQPVVSECTFHTENGRPLRLRYYFMPDLRRKNDLRGARAVVVDITARKKAEDELVRNIAEKERLNLQVRELHSRLLNLQEKERQKIASDLHDSVGQTMLAAKMNLISSMTRPGSSNRFHIGLSLIDRASQELREIYTNLYPSSLRELGLSAAVRSYIKSVCRPAGIDTRISISLNRKLPEDVEINLFRIIQEASSNAIKYSKAGRLTLTLSEKSEKIKLVISDNGIGFEPARKKLVSRGFGVDNIRRRVEDMQGDMKIESTPGKGVKIKITLLL